jgi:RimJ/RimL family protein N-acetyltransferase
VKVANDEFWTNRKTTLIGPEITTHRLMLSQLIESDAPAMYEYRSAPEVFRYQSFEPSSIEDVEAFIGNLQSNAFDTPGSWFQFAIRLKESDLLVGDVGVHFTADDPLHVELGFTMAPAYQGKGLGTESVTGLLDYLLVTCQKHRVFASVDPRNEPSIALLKRVGMRKEAHDHKSLWFKGDWVDDLVFGISNSQWESRSRS